MTDLPKLNRSSTSHSIYKAKNFSTGEKRYWILWRCLGSASVVEDGFRTRTQAEARAEAVMSGAIEPVAFQWSEDETPKT